MINIKSKLYKVSRNGGLSDYCLFNQNKNDIKKNEFLNLLLNAIMKEEWFDLSKFSDLGTRPIDRQPTQVAFADNETKTEEFNALAKTFKREELETLIFIIDELKSFGVYPIKELMDNHDEANERKNTFSTIGSYFKIKNS